MKQTQSNANRTEGRVIRGSILFHVLERVARAVAERLRRESMKHGGEAEGTLQNPRK